MKLKRKLMCLMLIAVSILTGCSEEKLEEYLDAPTEPGKKALVNSELMSLVKDDELDILNQLYYAKYDSEDKLINKVIHGKEADNLVKNSIKDFLDMFSIKYEVLDEISGELIKEKVQDNIVILSTIEKAGVRIKTHETIIFYGFEHLFKYNYYFAENFDSRGAKEMSVYDDTFFDAYKEEINSNSKLSYEVVIINNSEQAKIDLYELSNDFTKLAFSEETDINRSILKALTGTDTAYSNLEKLFRKQNIDYYFEEPYAFVLLLGLNTKVNELSEELIKESLSSNLVFLTKDYKGHDSLVNVITNTVVKDGLTYYEGVSVDHETHEFKTFSKTYYELVWPIFQETKLVMIDNTDLVNNAKIVNELSKINVDLLN